MLKRSFLAAAAVSASLFSPPLAFAQSSLFEEVHGMLPNRVTWPMTAVFGDINGDGQPDLLVGRDPYLNAGAGRLVDLPNGQSLELSPEVLVDVDGDGDLDALSSQGLLLNDGDGQFQSAPASQLPASWTGPGQTPGGIVTGDVDGDGDLDVFFCNGAFSGGAQNRLFLNDGLGSFTDVTATQLPAESEASSLGQLTDVDGDGDLDLLVFDEPDQRLYLNDGNAVFAAAASPLPIALQGRGAVHSTGDVDGDGATDLLVQIANQSAPESRLLLNDGSGGFVDATSGSLSSAASALALSTLADVDGDGDLDALVATGIITVALNDGAGRFLEAVPSRTTPWPDQAQFRRFEDVDGDGDLDLFIARRSSAPSGAPLPVHDLLLLGDGTGRFEEVSATDLPFSGLRVRGNLFDGSAPVDYDGDGDLDLIVPSDLGAAGGVISFLENDGSGVFVDASARRFPAELLQPQFTGRLESFDADGDGWNDLMVLSPPRLFLNDGAGRFQGAPAGSLPTVQGSDPLTPVGDIEGDGDTDLVLLTSAGPELFFNDGAGTFSAAPQSSLPWSGGVVRSALPVDLDGDGAPELILSNYFSRTWVMKNDGAGRFVDETVARFPDPSFSGRSIEAADFDGDGDVDLLLNTESVGGTRLYLNDGSGVLQDASATKLPADSGGQLDKVILGDVDEDGDIDAVLNGTRLYLNDGQASFTMASPNMFGLSVGGFRGGSLSDLDGDGDLDLFAHVGRAAIYRNHTRQLAWRAVPRAGKPLTMDLSGSPGSAYALFVRSVGPVAGPWSVAQRGFLDGAGRAEYTRRVPASPALVGARLRFLARIDGQFSNVEPVTISDL